MSRCFVRHKYHVFFPSNKYWLVYQHFHFKLIYMFPPFSLLGSCIKKIRLEEANAVVVVPLWPTQPWFTRLMEMLDCFLVDDLHDAISTPTVFLEKPCSLYLFLTHDISLVSEFSGVNESLLCAA
jgi:hypothetical protein